MSMNPLTELGRKAKEVSRLLSVASTKDKDYALAAIAEELLRRVDEIVQENEKDLEAGKQAGLSSALLDRLMLNQERIQGIAKALEEIIALPDPVGQIHAGSTRPNGLRITKKAVPLGVIGIIYEARPNVTVDSASLCLKSGNACILRGGKEAIHTNKILVEIVRTGLKTAGLPEDSVQLVEDTSRELSAALMQLNGYVDALIPRGGQGLIQAVVKNATVPVIETGAGLCHLYVDKDADLSMALEILDNAKTSRPSVCNAIETLLVHQDIAEAFLPQVAARFKNRVELRSCSRSLPYLGEDALPATQADWATEHIDYILNIKMVDSLQEATDHIHTYSTKHSEAIISNNYETVQEYLNVVDAAAVYANASTRFTDGGEFGLGAEIGISTQKLHVRGPMGLEALTSFKYIVEGNGQIRV